MQNQRLINREAFLLGKIDALTKEKIRATTESVKLRLICEIDELRSELAELEREISERNLRIGKN